MKGTEAIMERHYRERVRYYTEKIEANPKDPNNYLQRAQQYHYLHEEGNVHADMSRYAAVLGQGRFPALQFGTPKRFRPVINSSSRYQFVFSVGRRENGIIVMSVAFGQKGRSNMKRFEIPMFVGVTVWSVSLCQVLTRRSSLQISRSGAGNLKSIIPVLDPAHEVIDCFSYDGLEMYITYNRPGGYGELGLVGAETCTQRTTDWGPPENLGPAVNSSKEDSLSSISADGLTLYFNSRPVLAGTAVLTST